MGVTEYFKCEILEILLWRGGGGKGNGDRSYSRSHLLLLLLFRSSSLSLQLTPILLKVNPGSSPLATDFHSCYAKPN